MFRDLGGGLIVQGLVWPFVVVPPDPASNGPCSLTDIGVDDKFVEDLAEHLKPGTSALFALVKGGGADKVVEKLKESGGRVLRTSLSHTDQAKLEEALDEVTGNFTT